MKVVHIRTRMKLRAIKFGCDFRKSEATLLDELRKNKSFPGELAANEVFLFISAGENQLVWILNSTEVATRGGATSEMVDSRRWRMKSAAMWHPNMLQEYAAQVGIELVGIRSFVEAYEQQREAQSERLRIAREQRKESA